MGWAKVSGQGGAIKGWDVPGEVAEGVYTGMREGKDFGNGRSTLADLVQADGTTVVTIGVPTALRNDLQKVSVGTKVHIEYVGKQKNPRTGREFKAFETQHEVPDGVATKPASSIPASGNGAEYDALFAKLTGAKGKPAADAIAKACKTLGGDQTERLKQAMQAQGVAA